ncbi:hypothetical protein ACIBKX_03785 [Streptomyces sp. NPDC050658]|uniref:SCO2400 family protein n=1 Tax=unclassified Streptomyces TaxID=2593676 RepID=UPI00343EB01A
MDYCHPCHRHLNGALACPGCGTPAEACREYAQAVAEQEAADGPEGAYDEESPRVRSRRRERGRKAHRRRRRKVLLITAGLALAAGGLSLAELATEGPSDDPRAASAPDGETGERPVTRDSAGPDEEIADGATATTAAPTASASASDKATRDAEREKEKKKRDQGDDEPGSTAPTKTSAPDSPDTPNTPDNPQTTRPTPPPTTQKPDPEPEPTPSETCDRFLWWCT